MVLLFPSTADRSKHYSTTNGVYGDFYGTTIREIKRSYDRHGGCNRKVAQLTEQLQEAKSCLEGVDYTCAMADQGHNRPRGPCCYGASYRGKPNCECRLRMPICLTPDDFKQPLAPVEWNCGQPLRCCNENMCSSAVPKQNLDCGQQLPSCNENICSFAPKRKDCGQQREPEFLEDHVRCYHPRLAPKPQVLPKVIFGQSNRPLTGDAYARRGVGSGGGFGVGLNSEMKSSGSNSRPRRRPGSPPPVAKKSALPATSRYNFYRYYGCAGQGAKTSQGYHPKP